MCISSSILKISPLVGEECRDQFLLGIAEEFAEFAAEGFRVGSFESMFASDILLDSFWEDKVTHLWIQKLLSKIPRNPLQTLVRSAGSGKKSYFTFFLARLKVSNLRKYLSRDLPLHPNHLVRLLVAVAAVLIVLRLVLRNHFLRFKHQLQEQNEIMEKLRESIKSFVWRFVWYPWKVSLNVFLKNSPHQ